MTGELEPRLRGFRGPDAIALAGITYRQLDYWARTGLVEPSVRAAHGSGTQRLYSRDDVALLRVVRELIDAGMSLTMIRAAKPGLCAAIATGTDITRSLSPNVRVTVAVSALLDAIPEPPPETKIPEPLATPTLSLVP